MKVQEIREIIRLIDQTSIDEFVFEQEGTRLEIKRGAKEKLEAASASVPEVVKAPAAQAEPPQPAEAPAASPAPIQSGEASLPAVKDETSYHKITSPMVGTFYKASSPDDDPFVKVGDRVGNESVVCIVEAMKLFNEIEAEVSGEIKGILVEDGQLVEYGQPLFLVKPE
ncbi:acetyl-CoA carboxylase [Bacillus sp. FJAT-27916]|uniref:acetyl-CoA carboxylase biotin carboxyl carrier protein n=1 Tax=Bacillus sp. FJAT-27916 TaxID=1679169 RepID=UPI0006707BB1|nr:acetyl-CoA carboxylase biotin carboxyl carrier protein [Bacillus sp. FJAT-27916]KMY46357.1 acetyl-CoA carboxylase [Bacillus sp. FJAT-27916]